LNDCSTGRRFQPHWRCDQDHNTLLKRFQAKGEGKAMTISRRRFLLGAGGLAAAAATGGLASCAPGSGGARGGAGGEGGAVNLALSWWGNPTRNKNTESMIDAYQQANPNVKITPQPGEGSSYWDKLATQTAGGQAPDIIQMDMNYIAEYGSRGALLDLKDVDTSKFVEGTVDSGRINDTLVGSTPASTARCSLPARKSSKRPRWTCPTTPPGPGTS
jgi:ABC-type glycerol-3-phosphate transport system substrate-binding protein